VSHVVESATSRRHRRNRRTAIILVVLVAVLAGAFYYAAQYFQRPPASSAAACPTSDITAGAADGLPAPGQITVNVYNTTGRAGLAADTAKSLKSLGYVIGAVSNDPAKRKIDGVGELRYGLGGQPGANVLKTVVPGTDFMLDKRADATIDLVIGNGFKSVTAPASTAPAAAAANPC